MSLFFGVHVAISFTFPILTAADLNLLNLPKVTEPSCDEHLVKRKKLSKSMSVLCSTYLCIFSYSNLPSQDVHDLKLSNMCAMLFIAQI